MTDKNVFVFVVCGDNEHIVKLNNAISYLKHFSSFPIVVITDSKRNHINIEHDNIIDVDTPAELSHHQASIFLKTNQHRILDMANNYCYLDSDVLALSAQVNNIFKYHSEPITFAADHCTIQSFSPYALHCGCLNKKEEELKQFIEAVRLYIPDYTYNNFYHNDKARALNREINTIKTKYWSNPTILFKYLWNLYIPCKNAQQKIKLKNYTYTPSRKAWFDEENNLLMYSVSGFYKEIEKKTDYVFSKKKQIWLNKDGQNIEYPKCTHLIDAVKTTFNVEVKDIDFRHWNGGVFLFNQNASGFMDVWHENILKIFKSSYWKTRDQGALIAATWQFGLQNKKVLPEAFNFMADYYNTNITYHHNKGFTNDNYKTTLMPAFIHVFHQYGNNKWDIWRAIEEFRGI